MPMARFASHAKLIASFGLSATRRNHEDFIPFISRFSFFSRTCARRGGGGGARWLRRPAFPRAAAKSALPAARRFGVRVGRERKGMGQFLTGRNCINQNSEKHKYYLPSTHYIAGERVGVGFRANDGERREAHRRRIVARAERGIGVFVMCRRNPLGIAPRSDLCELSVEERFGGNFSVCDPST